MQYDWNMVGQCKSRHCVASIYYNLSKFEIFTCYISHICEPRVAQSQLPSKSNQLLLAQGLKVVDNIIMMVVLICMYLNLLDNHIDFCYTIHKKTSDHKGLKIHPDPSTPGN